MWGALSRHKGRVGQGWGSRERDKGVPTALNKQTGRESPVFAPEVGFPWMKSWRGSMAFIVTSR